MRRAAFCTVVATALIFSFSPVSALAQIRIDEVSARQVAERGSQASAAGQRISVLLGQTLGDPTIAGARSPTALAAAVESRSVVITSARTELLRISAELDGLSPIPNPNNLDLIRSANQNPSNLADLARRGEGILEALATVPGKVAARDEAGFRSAVSALGSGSILMKEAQANMMRAQADLQQPDWPSRSQFLVMACLSDAQAGIALGTSDLSAGARAVSAIEAAETCIGAEIAQGRTTVTSANPLRARLAPLDSAIFEEMEGALGCVSTARLVLLRNERSDAVANGFNACYAPVGGRIQNLSAQQQRILAGA